MHEWLLLYAFFYIGGVLRSLQKLNISHLAAALEAQYFWITVNFDSAIESAAVDLIQRDNNLFKKLRKN